MAKRGSDRYPDFVREWHPDARSSSGRRLGRAPAAYDGADTPHPAGGRTERHAPSTQRAPTAHDDADTHPAAGARKAAASARPVPAGLRPGRTERPRREPGADPTAPSAAPGRPTGFVAPYGNSAAYWPAMLLLLLGCASWDDPWTATREVCGVGAHDWADLGVNGGRAGAPVAVLPDLGIEEACLAAIVDDFGGDADVLLAATGVGDTLTEQLAADQADATWTTGLSLLLLGGWWLLGDNAGTLGEVEANEWTDATFVTEMQAVAEDIGADDDAPLTQLLYAYAAGNITALQVDDRKNPGLGWIDHVMHLPRTIDTTAAMDLDPNAPLSMGTLLVHEARHARSGGHLHVACSDVTGDPDASSCDAGLDGGHGFQEATFAAYMRSGACDAAWPVAQSEKNHWTFQINLEWPGSPPCE